MMRLCLLWGLMLFFPLSAFAATLYLQDGKILRGRILCEDANNINIESGDSWQRIPRNTIEKFRSIDKQEPVEQIELREIGAGTETGAYAVKEVVFRLGTSQGTHQYKGNAAIPTPFSDTVDARTMTGEFFYYVSKNIGIGAGISGELANLNSLNATFNLFNTYAIFKVRSNPTNDQRYFFVVGQLGNGLLFGDKNYIFRTSTVDQSGGICWGLGAGVVVKGIVIESDFSHNNGKLKSVLVNGRPDGEYETQYSRINFSIGMLFQ